MTEEERCKIVDKLAQRDTDNIEIGDLLDYFYNKQVEFYNELINEELLEEYKTLDN